MYTDYYGFSHKPFELTPDPDLIFMSETHQEAISVLRYGVLNRKGFLQLTGNVGTGKSTLLQSLIQSLEHNVHLCYFPNPNFTVEEFYYYLGAKFGLEEFDGNKAKFIISLGSFLQKCQANNEHALLIVDEAQILSLEVLEEIRLISNQEAHDTFGVLSIFFVGQPEFNVLLNHQKLLPLRNRIGISFHITPLTLADTTAYIQFRLRKAGRTSALFSKHAFKAIHQATGGIPRTINILCDNALLEGFAEQRGIIDETIIRDCSRELRLTDRLQLEADEKTPEAEPNDEDSVPGQVQAAPHKPSNFFRPGRVLMTVIALFVFFFAIDATTPYWSRLPWTTPVKTWFEKLHFQVNETILPPVMNLWQSRVTKPDVSSPLIKHLPENGVDHPGFSENAAPDISTKGKKKLQLTVAIQTFLKEKIFWGTLQWKYLQRGHMSA